MIGAILRKHWMELRRLWLFLTAFALIPGIVVAFEATTGQGSDHPDGGAFLALFVVFVFGFFPSRFGGTGLATSKGGIAACSTVPSLLFTLSLPVRRRTLFFYRSVSGLLAMETAAAVALVVSWFLLVHVDASWRTLVPMLWLLPALVPLYFLDSLLLIRFSEMTTTQIQGVTLLILWLGLQWLGVPLGKMADTALHDFTPLPAALAVCLLSSVFAAATVSRLDRQSY